jgi:hypothetical protein
MKKITISPKTKVGELLDAYPELESVMMDMSPAFEKLKNPILRKTVARVATLQQIAVVGKLKVEDIVNRLRKETGQSGEISGEPESDYFTFTEPEWFDKNKIAITSDATPIINSGGSPMNEILQKAGLLKPAEILELKTPFVPAPILDILKTRGFRIFCVHAGESVTSYISR